MTRSSLAFNGKYLIHLLTWKRLLYNKVNPSDVCIY